MKADFKVLQEGKGIAKLSSDGKIDIVLPATGQHGWHISQGWVAAAERAGVLGRVFTPKATWGADTPHDDDGLLEALKLHKTSEFILVLGMDWHSQPLTHSEQWREAWRGVNSKILALIWEDYTSDFVFSQPDFYRQMTEAGERMCVCADWVYSEHEANVAFFKEKLGFNRISFQPFAIDTAVFDEVAPFSGKQNKLFFKGKIDNFGYEEGPYEQRKVIAGQLHDRLGDRFVFEDKFVTDHEFVQLLGGHRFHINLPSFSPSMTLRAFEVLGAGGFLFQFTPDGEITRQIFNDGQHLVFYDPQDVDGLFDKIEYYFRHPSLAEKIAMSGRERCYEFHSIGARLQQMIKSHTEWPHLSLSRAISALTTGLKEGDELIIKRSANSIQEHLSNSDDLPKTRALELIERIRCQYPALGSMLNGMSGVSGQKKIIFDSVFFQIANNGIARVWQSILYSLVHKYGRDSLLILDRAGSFKDDLCLGIDRIDVPAFDFNDSFSEAVAKNDKLVEFLEDDFVFMSSYYTHTSRGYNVQIAHDCIPEILKGAEPEWLHKKMAMQSANLIISVSQNTKSDLLHFYPAIDPAKVETVANGIPIAMLTARQMLMNHEDDPVRKAGLEKSKYFVFIGGRRGWNGYKNGIVLIRAYEKLKQTLGDAFDQKLLLIGGDPELEPELRAKISDRTDQDIIIRRADDIELLAFLREATALIYPSIYEGFGLPILEGMCVGCPVISSDAASMPEVGGDMALFFDPLNHNELADHMKTVSSPDYHRASDKLKVYAEAFVGQWDEMRNTIVQRFEQAVSERMRVRQTSRLSADELSDLPKRIAEHYA